MKIIKLKIICTKLRALSEYYGPSMQVIARKSELSWSKGRGIFTGNFPTGDIKSDDGDRVVDRTVIDVTDEHTLDQWREMINTYVEREFAQLPDLEQQIIEARAEAKKLRDDLPEYIEV